MREVLGHDCDGRPLRAGDRVVIVEVYNPAGMYLKGQRCAVYGPSRDPSPWSDVQIDIPSPFHEGRYWCAWSRCLRRLDDQPEAGTWDDVRRATGWSPQRESQREEA